MTVNENDEASARRVALVTGASRGLGRALAAALLERGWRVVIDARGAEALRRTAAELGHAARLTAIAGDVGDASHRAALVDAASRAGRLDLLVNNAGTLGPSPRPTLDTYPADALLEVLRINAVAPLALVQQALPRLGDGACVINVSSDAAIEPYPGWGGYGASKAALERLSAGLGVERPALRIYAFDPGDMATEMHRQAFPGEDISDRPPPEAVVPALLRLVSGDLPSGRYRAAELPAASAA